MLLLLQKFQQDGGGGSSKKLRDKSKHIGYACTRIAFRIERETGGEGEGGSSCDCAAPINADRGELMKIDAPRKR